MTAAEMAINEMEERLPDLTDKCDDSSANPEILTRKMKMI
jgi:hypothetical protein